MTAIALESTLPAAAKRLSGRPLPVWGAEVLSMPARLLLELPLSPSLALHVPGVEGIVRVSADGEADEGDLGFDLDEWRALVLGVEADRVWPLDLTAFCRRKAAEPAYRLEPVDALAGGQPDPRETWDLATVLDRLGVELLGVEMP